jgi:dihydrofolate reductase
MRISTIAAVAMNGVIGKDNDLVWKLRDDMKFFMDTTQGHVVITGRRNYESIPAKYRPLKGRTNVVVTRNRQYQAEGAIVVHSLQDGIDLARAQGESECFIIGGGQIYREALASGQVDTQYITHVHAHPEGDTHYPVEGWQGWDGTEIGRGSQDENHEHAYVIMKYSRPVDGNHAHLDAP